MQVHLGDRVRDRVTGLTGIAIARTEWMYGCVRVVVQPEALKDGRPVDNVQIDEPQLDVVKKDAVENLPQWRDAEETRRAGPRPDATRPDVSR